MGWVRAGLRGLHRVVGTGIALLVVLWFWSGAVLLFVPYPNLSEVERFRWLEPLQMDGCCVTVESVMSQVASAQGIERMRLLIVAGRPLYVVHFLDGTMKSLWADRGETAQLDAVHIVRQGQTIGAGRSLETLWDDQWTVHQRFDAHRPLWKVQLHDVEGTEFYLSSTTGEVVMDSTAFERQWNTVGAVIHWLYVPLLRRHWDLWNQSVWWLAAAGLMTALSGLALGILHLSRERGHNQRSQFSGMKRWHHLGGIVIGAVVCLWLLSGMLSMDHGRWFSRAEPTLDQRQMFMGGPLAPQDIAVSLEEALRLAKPETPVKEIVLTKVGGRSYYVLRSDPSHQVVVSADSLQASGVEFSLQALTQAASALFPAGNIMKSERMSGDAYYYSTVHNPRSFPGLRVVMDDPAETWLHMDMQTGQLIELMDRSRRVYRWLFHGLHSWDIPYLLGHDGQRKGLLLVFCVAGLLFSLSGLYLGIRVLVGRS